MSQIQNFDTISVGEVIRGPAYLTSRETIKEYAEASLDYNPLHLDEAFMQGDFGKTNFSGVIVHGMTTFSIITRALVDWLEPRGGNHKRLETRWRAPVKPGDTIQPSCKVTAKKETRHTRWVQMDIEVKNQRDEVVATGEAMAEFPAAARTSERP